MSQDNINMTFVAWLFRIAHDLQTIDRLKELIREHVRGKLLSCAYGGVVLISTGVTTGPVVRSIR